MMLFVLIFSFDRLIYEILDIVARHSYMVYTQKGIYLDLIKFNGTSPTKKAQQMNNSRQQNRIVKIMKISMIYTQESLVLIFQKNT